MNQNKDFKEQKLLDLMDSTGYNICQENGQRVYGPPPKWPEGRPPPSKGCEIFIGKIPRDCYEDELVPLLSQIGPIYQLRLMMDFSGTNRGYAFATYTTPSDAHKAIKILNNTEIRPNKRIGVVQSLDNCRLFIGNIPLNKTREDIIEELSKVTEGVQNAIVYNNNTKDEKQYRNRGFAFVEYRTHRDAAMARRKLLPGKIKLFDCEISVDWAVPEPALDDEIMSQVMVLFTRHLSADSTEEMIKNVFSLKGPKLNVQKVKKIKNYAFIHYFTREDAELALQTLTKTDLRRTGLTDEGQPLEICWAKPANAVNNYNRRKKRSFNPNNSGGDYFDMKSSHNPFSPQFGPILPQLNPLSPPFDYNNSKHFSQNLYPNLMSGDSNSWAKMGNSPQVLMPQLRHNSRTTPGAGNTPVQWYSLETHYPWLPVNLVRSPQTIGVFPRSPQPSSSAIVYR